MDRVRNLSHGVDAEENSGAGEGRTRKPEDRRGYGEARRFPIVDRLDREEENEAGHLHVEEHIDSEPGKDEASCFRRCQGRRLLERTARHRTQED